MSTLPSIPFNVVGIFVMVAAGPVMAAALLAAEAAGRSGRSGRAWCALGLSLLSQSMTILGVYLIALHYLRSC